MLKQKYRKSTPRSKSLNQIPANIQQEVIAKAFRLVDDEGQQRAELTTIGREAVFSFHAENGDLRLTLRASYVATVRNFRMTVRKKRTLKASRSLYFWEM
jgi:hypothetical protein